VVRSVCGWMLMAFVSLVWASTSFRDPDRLSRQRTKLSALGGDPLERGLRSFSQQGQPWRLRHYVAGALKRPNRAMVAA
jgi:hypothetical protein